MVAVRAVLSVALALAIVSVAGPAIEDARINRTEGELAADIQDVTTAVRTLARSAPVVRGDVPTSRRFAEISVPAPGPGRAGLAALVIGGPLSGGAPADDGSRDLLVYRVRGGSAHRVWVGVDLRVGSGGGSSPDSLGGDGETLRIDSPGVHRFALRPVLLDDHVAVVVVRVGA